MSPKPMPLHHQLREKLLNRILRGEWAPGTVMATEHELAAEYGVSRQTIREAIRALRYEGVVAARRGSGTFVRDPLPGGPLTLHYGPGSSLTVANVSTEWATHVVRRETRAVGEAETALEVPPGTPVLLIEKLRFRNGQPFCLTYSFCLGQNGSEPEPSTSAAGPGVLTILSTVLHPYEARLLAGSAHTAALQLEALRRDALGRPIDFHRIVIPNTNLLIDLSLSGDELALLDHTFDFAR